MKQYIDRRKRLLDRDDSSIYIVYSGEFVTRSHDTEFPFRQDSNFYYLTGFDEPASALVLCSKTGKSHLFLRENNPEEAMWIGTRMGLERAHFLLDL